jgi:peptidoglycan hydrolase-like protein with peptidoglycan-binding domain
VRSDKKFYDDASSWDIGTMAVPLPRPRPVWTELPTLMVRSTGKDVVKLQQLLADAGFPPEGGADGFFGEKTDEAVRKFQEAKGLAIDGRVGTYTWRALGLT